MKRWLRIALVLVVAPMAGGAVAIVQDQCGPFTDVSPALCPYVLEVYYLGITAGTSSTTYSPDAVMTRGQAAVFVAKGVNQALARSSRRAALGQWWTTESPDALGLTSVGAGPGACASDGTDVWTRVGAGIARVRASDGALLETWGAVNPGGSVLIAMGRIFFVSFPGGLQMIDPAQPPGTASAVAQVNGARLAFDGERIWAADQTGFTVEIITPGPTLPWATTSVQLPGGTSEPTGILFDGSNVWVTTNPGRSLLRLDRYGDVLQTVFLGDESAPAAPVFDGTNLWVPDLMGKVNVVRTSDGTVIATLTGNGLDVPLASAFDGLRVLVTVPNGVSVWNAADLSPIGFTPIAGNPSVPCSDGINFWIPLATTGQLARY
jgi:hypothetical protein